VEEAWPDLRSLLRAGPAVIVATSDERLRPQVSRGWGPELEPGGTVLVMCVAAAAGSPMHANLERGGTIAATFSAPTTYRSVQLKGPVLTVGEPVAEQLSRVDEHLAAFVEQVAQVGLPPSRAPRLREPALLAVQMEIRERYDQTPGPKAGSPL
jgi:hypothetical protein